MQRLYVAKDRLGVAELRLEEDQLHYLRDVLRLGPGAPLELFDGEGGRHEGTLTDTFAVRIGARLPQVSRAVDVVVAQALAKADKLELVIQKCTELGATRIVPFVAARSVVKLDAERGRDKAARWQRIAQEAARQCGRADVPAVDEPLAFAGMLALARGRRALALDPAATQRLSDAGRGASEVLVAVGPEGGFTAEELDQAAAAGFARVALGPLVLRTETAALAALAVLQHVNGALG